MKKLITFSLVLSIAGYSSALAQTTPKTKTDSVKVTGVGIKLRGGNGPAQEPLYILDGVAISADAISLINPDNIEAVNVLKDPSAIVTYGPKAVNGVVLITTKGSGSKQSGSSDQGQGNGLKIRGNATTLGKDILVIVDDVIIDSQAMETIKPDTIHDVSIFKDAESKLKYGEKAQNGVIVITTKEYALKKNNK